MINYPRKSVKSVNFTSDLKKFASAVAPSLPISFLL